MISPCGLVLTTYTFSDSNYEWGLENWNYGKLKVLGCEVSY
jgi:hypothetical protein